MAGNKPIFISEIYIEIYRIFPLKLEIECHDIKRVNSEGADTALCDSAVFMFPACGSRILEVKVSTCGRLLQLLMRKITDRESFSLSIRHSIYRSSDVSAFATLFVVR